MKYRGQRGKGQIAMPPQEQEQSILCREVREAFPETSGSRRSQQVEGRTVTKDQESLSREEGGESEEAVRVPGCM